MLLKLNIELEIDGKKIEVQSIKEAVKELPKEEPKEEIRIDINPILIAAELKANTDYDNGYKKIFLPTEAWNIILDDLHNGRTTKQEVSDRFKVNKQTIYVKYKEYLNANLNIKG